MGYTVMAPYSIIFQWLPKKTIGGKWKWLTRVAKFGNGNILELKRVPIEPNW